MYRVFERVTLEEQPDAEAWVNRGKTEGLDATSALRAYARKHKVKEPTTFFTVPARSFNPRTLVSETKTTTSLKFS